MDSQSEYENSSDLQEPTPSVSPIQPEISSTAAPDESNGSHHGESDARTANGGNEIPRTPTPPSDTEKPDNGKKPWLIRHPVSIMVENSDFSALEWDGAEAYSIIESLSKKAIIVPVMHHSVALRNLYELSTRPEVEMDTKSLSLQLTKAGFSVDVVKDPTRSDMLDLLNQEAEKQAGSLEDISCFVLVILTQSIVPPDSVHEAVFMYDGLLSCDEICSPFTKLKPRKHPLVFLVHAPAGGHLNLSSSFLRKKSPISSSSKSDCTSSEPDVLVIRSTAGEHLVFRKPQSGSLFVQQICLGLQFNEGNPEMDFVKILTRWAALICKAKVRAVTSPQPNDEVFS